MSDKKAETKQNCLIERPVDDERTDMIVLYLEAKRRALITELREVEMLLGWPQSIPARQR